MTECDKCGEHCLDCKCEFIPPFKPFSFDNTSEIFHDLESGKSYHLRSGQKNFLEKLEGFCPTCKLPYTSRWEIEVPHTKNLLGTKCSSYWHSINESIPESKRPKYCGHEERKGWLGFHEIYE